MSVIFTCCYCTEVLDEDQVGVSLYDIGTGKPGQCWFAHETCFRERLHPDYDVAMDELDWEDAEIVDPEP
jgi:hypothetical protein